MAITHIPLRYMRYIYVRLRCTSKVGVRLFVRFFVSPRREEQTDVWTRKPHPLHSEDVPGL